MITCTTIRKLTKPFALAAVLLVLLTVSPIPAQARIQVAVGAECGEGGNDTSAVGQACGPIGEGGATVAQCSNAEYIRDYGNKIVCRRMLCTTDDACTSQFQGYTCQDLSDSLGSYRGCVPGQGVEEDSSALETAAATPGASAPVAPTFSVDIPTVSLSEAVINKEGNNRFLDLPWIADYISGVFQYAVFVASILAAVMMMIGGVQWLTSAGNPSQVNAGKQRITNALIGLGLVLSTYVILTTINPDLVALKPLRVQLIETDHVFPLPEATCAEILGGPPPSREEMVQIVRLIADENNIDRCEFEAIVGKESGYRACVIGHDENAPRHQVSSRVIFINSGVKYSGETFAPRNALITIRSHANDDDRFDKDAPPNYGLDPRFSHGIGLGQLTINLPCSESRGSCTETRCPDGNLGLTIAGECYTVPELFDPTVQMTAVVELYKQKINACPANDVPCRFYRYAGAGCSARLAQCRKIKAYARCKGTSHNEIDECRDWIADGRTGCLYTHARPEDVPAPSN